MPSRTPRSSGDASRVKRPTGTPPVNTAYRNPEQSTVDYGRDVQKEALAQMPPTYQDPFMGQDPLTALLAQLHQTAGGGTGTGGGHGGGSGTTAADLAARAAAYQQAQNALDLQGTQANAGFDQRQQSLQGIQSGANTRLSDILGTLAQGAGQARTQTAQAYGQGDARLQALQGEYANIAHNRDAQANQTLGAFGAASGGTTGQVNPSGGGVQDMLMAGRAENTMRGNAADQLYAQRGNVYNGLGADSRMQNGQMFDALLAKLAQERQAQDSALSQQKAALALKQAGG